MAVSHRPFHHDLFPAHIRYPVLVLTYVLLKPLLWLVDRAGYSDRLWAALSRKMKAKMLAGHDFGDYRPSRHDVVVCTFPKCGTNWTMQIAYQIAMRGKGEFRHIHDVVPWPDFARQDLIVPLSDDTARKAAPTGLRVIETHLEWEQVPYTPDEFAAVCEKSSFAYMKGIDEKFKPPALTPWSSPNRQMIRRGVSGGSAELLSPEQQGFIDTTCRAELARIGSDFAYDTVWGSQADGKNKIRAEQGVEQQNV